MGQAANSQQDRRVPLVPVAGASGEARRRRCCWRQHGSDNSDPFGDAGAGIRKSLYYSYRVAAPFFRAPGIRCRAFVCTFVFVLLIVLDNALNIYGSYIFRDFNTAIQLKDEAKIQDVLVRFVAINILNPLLSNASTYAAGCLELVWWRYLTESALGSYLDANHAYYKLKASGGIDNPDERICDDNRAFAHQCIVLFGAAVGSLIQCVLWVGVLYQISPPLFYLSLVRIPFFTVLIWLIFTVPLIRLYRRGIMQQATVRYMLVRVRENSESIAFYQGAAFEAARCNNTFSQLVSTMYKQLGLALSLNCVLVTMGGLTDLLPIIFVLPLYMQGKIDLGTYMQSGIAATNVKNSLAFLEAHVADIASMGSVAVRLHQLQEAFKNLQASGAGEKIVLSEVGGADHGPAAGVFGGQAPPTGAGARSSPEQAEPADAAAASDVLLRVAGARSSPEQAEPADAAAASDVLLRVAGVSVWPPLRSRCDAIISDLTLTLRRGESLLLRGESGTGKTSMLRAIAGLWTDGHGVIERCPLGRCLFLPQLPYMCIGTLRDQVCYGARRATAPSDAEVQQVLQDVNLSHILSRHGLGQHVNFAAVLSPGEQQRLSFARVLVSQPSLVLLDEATSAMDGRNEMAMYQLLKDRVTCFVSVAHRPGVRQFHSHEIVFTMQTGSGAKMTALSVDGPP